jgi:HD-GYP domain-containing protein (c-di-GMP phosphodiesterase class II)
LELHPGIAMARRYPLQVHISTLFLTLVLVVGGGIGWLGYDVSRTILDDTAGDLEVRIEDELQRAFMANVQPAELAARVLSVSSLTGARTLEGRLEHLPLLRELLRDSPAVTSLYVGYANGDFFMIRRLWNDEDQAFFNAPAGAGYLVQSIENAPGGRSGRFIFLDERLEHLRSEASPAYATDFDPRTRLWYGAALEAGHQIRTLPYLFHSTAKVGMTAASPAEDGSAVAGADVRLETLDAVLASNKLTPNTQIAIVTRAGEVIAHEAAARLVRPPASPDGKPRLPRLGDLGAPVLSHLAGLLPGVDNDRRTNLDIRDDGERWRVTVRPFRPGVKNSTLLVTAIPDSELMASAHALLKNLILALVAVILAAIPVTLALARKISRDLHKLAGEAEGIRRFDFSQPIAMRSMISEVDDLAQTMDAMKETIRRFIDVTHAIADEKNFDRLLPRLLSETMAAADAGAGVLYLADNAHLRPAAALRADGTVLTAGDASVALAECGPLLATALGARKAQSGRLSAADIAALHLPVGDEKTDHAIALPLLNRSDVLVGVMLLIRAEASDPAQISFIEALAGSSAVSLETRELIRAQKVLFESFIQLIAAAIDAKSPYTGGHCARVPELTKMLARAACAESDGPFKDFQLNDEEWEAVHVAAWLHDCGKVTTPEYVVDKATKLETLYDRIHEVRMRFEVLKRDAEIACLKAIARGEPDDVARNRLAGELRALDDDFAFVATCNEGGEFMAPEKLARLQEIAARTWTRTLDDRIGISHEEKLRKDRTPLVPLPASEPLLADKPEHRFERSARDVMAADNPWGFRMPVPELLYNKGELYNLSVARGTLSEEERHKINEHIVQTLIMLSELPFPKHLREVPEIAAGHHEKMDGTGYPRRLTRDQMSPLARMMAIADIFEALTAVDRPYKKGKTLSEAIKIMTFMKRDGHIDPELFELFLRAGVYREYAEAHLRPEQIDEVDIEAALAER